MLGSSSEPSWAACTRSSASSTPACQVPGAAESAACGTDSAAPGTWQAGVEEALDLVQAAQEGSELLPSIGLVNVYTLFYPEHLLLGDDIYHRARYAVMDLDLDDESMALDAVAEVGPGGHFLGNGVEGHRLVVQVEVHD